MNESPLSSCFLSCTEDGEPGWAETTCRKILKRLTEELDDRPSAKSFPAEDATERMQDQGTFV